MSALRLTRQSNAFPAPPASTALTPTAAQAVRSTSLGLALARAVDTVTISMPIEPTVKLILKNKFDGDVARARRHVMLLKLVGLAGSQGHMGNLEQLIEHGSQAHQVASEAVVAEALKVVIYAPNRPEATAARLRKTMYARFQQRFDQP